MINFPISSIMSFLYNFFKLSVPLTFTLLICFAYVSCRHEPEINPPEVCDTLNITYASRVYPILLTHCIGCHGGSNPSAGLDFSSYSNVAAIASDGRLIGVITHAPGFSAMPPGGKLSDCQIRIISRWIRDTVFVNPPGGIPCHPDTVYFENTILPLLISSCAVAGCHDASSQTAGVNLTTYPAIIQTGGVKPFNPDGSDLYEVITEDDPDKRMPPPPRNPLTQNQIQTVYRWIMQGALNNRCNPADCDTINVTFSGTIWPIIQGRCYGCHSGSSPSGGVSLQNHQDIAMVAVSGRLLGAVKHQPGYAPMPPSGPQLTNCQINQIKKWIENGTPNN